MGSGVGKGNVELNNILHGNFKVPLRDAPDWAMAAVKRHQGLRWWRDEKRGYLEGTDAKLPNGKVIQGSGYLRTTGQWRETTSGYEVEVFCCKTLRSSWVPTKLLLGVRTIDNL